MRLSAATVALACIAGIATLSACGDDGDSSGSLPRLVYYESFASDSNRIVRVDADGSDRTVLWEGTNLGGNLAVAPDGAVLFAATPGWQLLPPTGGAPTPFTVPNDLSPRNPQWSRDGQRILWEVVTATTNALGVQVPGSATLQVITPDSLQTLLPDWAPDGQRLAFLALNKLRGTYNLYTIARDGSDLRKVTPDSLYVAAPPSWSHDGTRIAYGRGDIFTMAPDGSDVRNVTNGATCNINGFGLKLWWSPDDREFITQSSGNCRIVVSTGAVTSLGVLLADGNPWSLDGSRISYLTRTPPDENENTMPAIGVARRNGTGGVQVSANDIGSYAPAWVPHAE